MSNAPEFTVTTETEDENSTVTVLHGYGRVSPNEKHWIDNTLFVGGVARSVPRAIAESWKKVSVLGKAIRILPEDASEAEFARASGIQPMATPKFAAMLRAIDIEKVGAELDPVTAREIGEALIKQAEGKVVRDSQGKWRSKTQGKNETPA